MIQAIKRIDKGKGLRAPLVNHYGLLSGCWLNAIEKGSTRKRFTVVSEWLLAKRHRRLRSPLNRRHFR